MNVCCLIVTYGDRFKFLLEVVGTLWPQGVKEVVIISNGSDVVSNEQIDKLQMECFPKIKVYNFNKNEGTAIAFRKGLQIVEQSHCDFIWILDDDNKPGRNSLKELR